MCSNQNWNVKLAYVGFGCLFGSLCTIMGMLTSPVTAQRDKFDRIECMSLRVVDANGNPKVVLDLDEENGRVVVYGKVGVLPQVGLHGGEHGGRLDVWGMDGRTSLSSNLGLGRVMVWGEDGYPKVGLNVTKQAGRVVVWGRGKGQATMSIDESGNGVISTWDKNGDRQ